MGIRWKERSQPVTRGAPGSRTLPLADRLKRFNDQHSTKSAAVITKLLDRLPAEVRALTAPGSEVVKRA